MELPERLGSRAAAVAQAAYAQYHTAREGASPGAAFSRQQGQGPLPHTPGLQPFTWQRDSTPSTCPASGEGSQDDWRLPMRRHSLPQPHFQGAWLPPQTTTSWSPQPQGEFHEGQIQAGGGDAPDGAQHTPRALAAGRERLQSFREQRRSLDRQLLQDLSPVSQAAGEEG